MAKNSYYVVLYNRVESLAETKHLADVLEIGYGGNLIYEIRQMEARLEDTPTKIGIVMPCETKKEAVLTADDWNKGFKEDGHYMNASEAFSEGDYKKYEAELESWSAKHTVNAEKDYTPMGHRFSGFLCKEGDEYHVDIRIYNIDAERYDMAESLYSDFDRSEGCFSQAIDGSYNEIRQVLYNSPFPVGFPSEKEIAAYGDEVLYINDDVAPGCQRVYTVGEDKNLEVEFAYTSDLSSDYYAGLHNDLYDDLRHDEPEEQAVEKHANKDHER